MQSHLLTDRGALVPQADSPEPFCRDVDADASAGAQIAAVIAENRELKAELEQLRAERARWRETQERIMQLLGTKGPEKLVHDLRNVLNERDLLKALVDEL